MALSKVIDVDRVEIFGNGVMTVRWSTTVLEDGVELVRNDKMRKYEVAQDMTGEPTKLQNISAAVWTQGVKDARLAELNAESAAEGGPQWASMEDYHAGITI